jgi:hypothetical protein
MKISGMIMCSRQSLCFYSKEIKNIFLDHDIKSLVFNYIPRKYILTYLV